jgi:hypothetical protein
MGRRRIFVSHSNSDPDSPAYIEELERTLSAADFDVLVDRNRLNPGANWRDDVYTWMGLCHGAVILISEAAIQPDSIWVPRETGILLWRRTLDTKFIVIPACLGNVTVNDLRGGVFADMQLGEIQTAPATTPRELAAAVTQRFAALTTPKTPLESLASRMAELLLTVSDNAIEEAIDSLSVDLGPCKPVGDTRYALSLALLQTPLRGALAPLEVLAEYMEGSKVDQILAMIAPSWVDLCAARWLADCGTRVDHKPAAVLNASTPFCARMYVDRASCRPPKTRWPIVNSAAVHGEWTAQEIASEVEENLIHEFRLADDPQMPDARVRLNSLLRERQREGRPVFVSLRFSPAVGMVLRELQRMLPGVTFVLMSGEEFPPPETLERRSVRFIEPRLQRGAEAQAQLDFDYVRSIVRPHETVVF